MSAQGVTALAWSFPLPILSIRSLLPCLARAFEKPVPKLMADSLKIRILVRPKAGILDPQGEAVRRRYRLWVSGAWAPSTWAGS